MKSRIPENAKEEVYLTPMTKREYFAALALQGLLARGAYANDAAKEAVLFADELINELNKEK